MIHRRFAFILALVCSLAAGVLPGAGLGLGSTVLASTSAKTCESLFRKDDPPRLDRDGFEVAATLTPAPMNPQQMMMALRKMADSGWIMMRPGKTIRRFELERLNRRHPKWGHAPPPGVIFNHSELGGKLKLTLLNILEQFRIEAQKKTEHELELRLFEARWQTSGTPYDVTTAQAYHVDGGFIAASASPVGLRTVYMKSDKTEFIPTGEEMVVFYGQLAPEDGLPPGWHKGLRTSPSETQDRIFVRAIFFKK